MVAFRQQKRDVIGYSFDLCTGVNFEKEKV